ncbi:Glucan 1,3-beta-glucosidase 3 [Varicellaria rhodocarpa]|nr:Glucan 1,3-beta-glucosidase 3 [Varicellaria rhodocarpa]
MHFKLVTKTKKLFRKVKELRSRSEPLEPLPTFPEPTSLYRTTPQWAVHQDYPSTSQPPTPLDVLRYRYHYGSNLGGVFVLEQWLFPNMFDQGVKGSSELDAVTQSLAIRGVDATRLKWETHWANALSDHDLHFLTAYCTSIRLPIGYFSLGKFFTAKTPFEGALSEIYDNAWSAIKSLCTRLHNAGIGVLLDLHACPGGANEDAHSGTSSRQANLWDEKWNLNATIRCLQFIANEVRQGHIPGCIGIQCCNEAIYNAPNMYDWYEEVLFSLSTIDHNVPLYISDGWNLRNSMAWAASRNKVHRHSCPVIVDTHKYYTFSYLNKSQSPQEIIRSVRSELNEVAPFVGSVMDNGAVDVMVGEWSCVLDGETWDKAGHGANREDLVRKFGTTQCSQWQQHTGGSCFWTTKMAWMDGGEWGFVEMTKKAAIQAPSNMFIPHHDIPGLITKTGLQRATLRAAAVKAHVEYWVSTAKGRYEHWRFEAGWDVGFSDAAMFFGMRARGGIQAKAGGDMIGMMDAWVRKRLAESGMAGGFVWEFEQGFREAEEAFRGVVMG